MLFSSAAFWRHACFAWVSIDLEATLLSMSYWAAAASKCAGRHLPIKGVVNAYTIYDALTTISLQLFSKHHIKHVLPIRICPDKWSSLGIFQSFLCFFVCFGVWHLILTDDFQRNARNGSGCHFEVYTALVDRMVLILYIVYGQLGLFCSSYLKWSSAS